MSITISDIVTEYRELDGIYIRPCVGSGFCCIKTPCGHGHWNEDHSACAHLLPANEIGQRGCGTYDHIKEIDPFWMYHPAFGSGCSSPMFNELRDAVISKLPEEIKKKIR